jgi:hypothetical protein
LLDAVFDFFAHKFFVRALFDGVSIDLQYDCRILVVRSR